MKKSKYTEDQIAFALKQAELGTPIPGTGVMFKNYYPSIHPSSLYSAE